MGFQELMLLAIHLFSFCYRASFSLVSENLVSVNTHENMGDNGIAKSDSTIGGGGRIVNESKYTTAMRASRGGGARVIPVYAAGAAGQNNIHKGAATCGKGGSIVLIATSASFLLYMSLYKM